MKQFSLVFFALIIGTSVFAQRETNTNDNRFRQLYDVLPTPNAYRAASGAPGHEYWQQKADYNMKITLDDSNQRVYGEETIKYTNNSPDVLTYLWVQLDQNVRAKDSDTYKIQTSSISERSSLRQLKSTMGPEYSDYDGGFKVDHVKDASGKAMNYVINKTMMRIDLDSPLKPGANVSFSIKWWYNINDRMAIGGRSGYEYFEENDNYLYTIAQFFPRMATYTDNEGWQNKQFLGRGEFALVFGDYDVSITVPEDHYVSATGVLTNEKDVLTAKERKRFEEARTAYEEPVIIVTQAEAEENEKTKATKNKTWRFKAENVRDFAFASSRKFIWDAMAVKQKNGTTVMAMSMYPKEGNPLWEQYSTKAVAHTLKWYSHFTFDYPYPVAWSIHAASIGMEYPMICFNFGRPEKDGTYTARTKYGMIGVIIHEVGHNYFPMIVNSDERQWTWMDEGLNSFLQYLTEQQFERGYPSRSGAAYKITRYMGGDKSKISPIMTNSESIFQFGNNAYSKPATALNILRETVMGPELFDHAFKTYSNRWMMKHPSPADFFRTMEDASGIDLDWFWRSWFYTNDHVDIAINDVKWFALDTKNPEVESVAKKAERDAAPKNISEIRYEAQEAPVYNEVDKGLVDFYTTYDPLDYTILDVQEYNRYYNNLSDEEKELIDGGYNFYELTLENLGGIPMPVILQFDFEDGSSQEVRIPAEIWRMDQAEVSKVFTFEKEVTQVSLDPFLETADVDTGNNYYPARKEMSRFELYKGRSSRGGSGENPMQRAMRAEEEEK
jgi:hypothetical protein